MTHVQEFRPNSDFIENTNHNARKAWHDALTNINYKQTHGELFDGVDGFCCLGVYAHRVCGVYKESLLDQGTLSSFNGDFDHRLDIGPNPMVGSTNHNAFYATELNDNAFYATELNDTFGLTFDQIAQLVYPEAYADDPMDVVVEARLT